MSDLLFDIGGGLRAALAIVMALLLPGFAITRCFGLGRDALERFTLAIAFGRIAFAAYTLFCVTVLDTPASWGWIAIAAGLALVGWRRTAPSSERRLDRSDAVAVALSIAGALLVAGAIVARSALRDANGALLFFGRDGAFDPLMYAAITERLLAAGLPLSHPFAAGSPVTAQYVPVMLPGALARLGGLDVLDVVFRVLSIFDLTTVGIAAACVARALGGGAIAVAAAPLFVLLASDPSFLFPPIASLLGGTPRPIDTWAFFGPYLLAFNPIAPALHALFAGLLLLGAAPARRAAAIAGGVLVGSLFESKLFLWAPAIGGLLATAWLWPPAHAARALRVASIAAVATSLPSLVEKAIAAARFTGTEEIGFRLCPGCVPRYLLAATFADGELSFAGIRAFRLGDLAGPAALAAALGASALAVGLAMGARWIALAPLLRDARGDGGRAAVARMMAVGSVLGLGAACAIIVPPHYLNGLQFAWIAVYGLSPFAACAVETLARAHRALALAAIAFLALPSTIECLARLGFAAPVSLVVSADEQRLLAELPARAAPNDAVLEPSILVDPDVLSPLPVLTGRPVYLSLAATAQVLAPAEQERRLRHVAALFGESDREAARRALHESGAAFVYAPARWPLRVDPAGLLAPVARNPAGVLYRVLP